MSARRLLAAAAIILAAVVAAWFLLADGGDVADGAAGGARPGDAADGAHGGDETTSRARIRAGSAARAVSGADGTADTAANARRVTGRAWEDEARSKALAGVLVRLFPRSPDGDADDGRELDPLLRDAPTDGEAARTTTGADGAFVLEVPPHGKWWHLLATLEGHAPASVSFGRGEDDVDLLMPPLVRAVVEVTDEMDAPVAGAELRVGWSESQAPPHCVVRTGADGRAEIAAHPGGAMAVRAPGFAFTRISWDESPPDRVRLRRGLPCGGIVTDVSGAPIAGAEVEIYGDYMPRRRRRTDADGAFRFEAVDGGRLLVRADGFIERDLGATPGDVDLRVVLDRFVRVSGVVVSATGAPVPQAKVASRDRWDGVDSLGRFTILAAEGTTVVRAKADKAGPAGTELTASVPMEAVVAGRPVEGLRIVLGPAPNVSFVAVEVPDAAPSRKVHAFALDGADFLGNIDFTGPGPAVLPLRCAPDTAVEVRVYVEDGHPVHAAYLLTEVRTGAAEPYPRAVVRPIGGPTLVVRLDEGGRERKDLLPSLVVGARPAGPGRFSLVGFSAGAQVRFAAPGFASYFGNYRAPGTNDWRTWAGRGEFPEFELVLPLRRPATVRGRVLLAERGAPDAEAGTLITVDTGIALGFSEAGKVADDGTLRYESLPPGRAVLFVHPSRSGEIRREFDLAEGASIDLGDLVPPTVTLAWVEGVVRDETGRALGGVRVEPRYAQGGAADEPGWSAPDGTWRVRAPQVAGLRLALTKRGRARTVVAPAPPGTQTVVSMQREGKVLVRIPRRPSGSLVTWFLRTPADGSKINAPERGAPRDRGDWRSWVFEEVPPGAVEVVLRLSDGEIVRRVNVIGGETVEVVF